MATTVFDGIKFFQKIVTRTLAGTFLCNFVNIQYVVSEKKMFKEKVNVQTDGCTDGQSDTQTDARRTTDHDISSLSYGQWS